MFYKYLECLAGVERNSPVDGIWRPHHQLLRGPHSGWLRGRLKNKSLTFSDSSYSKLFSWSAKSWSFSLWDALPLLLAPWSSQCYSRWLTGVCWDLCSGPSTLHSSLSLRLKDGSESAGNHQCRLAVVVYIMQWTGTQTIREIIWGSSAKMLGNIDKVGSAQTDWKTEDRFYPISTYYHIMDYSSFFPFLLASSLTDHWCNF